MSDLLIKILFTLLSLYAGVLTWLARTAWQNIHENAKSIENIRLTCAACKEESHEDTEKEVQKLVDKISEMIDEKLDAWWAKIENNLMNDGRLPPRRRNKQES